jgi:hypothetical protein
MFLSEMTPEEQARDMDEWLAWQAEVDAEEASLTPAQLAYRQQAMHRLMEEEAIGELYASRYAFD